MWENRATRLHLRKHDLGPSVRVILDSKEKSGHTSHDIFYPADSGQDKQWTGAAERLPLHLSRGRGCDTHITSQSRNNSRCVQPDQARGLGTWWETTAWRSRKCYLSTNPLNSDQGVQWADADMHKSYALSASQRLGQGRYSNIAHTKVLAMWTILCQVLNVHELICNTARWAGVCPFYRCETLKLSHTAS